jgi:hypothetical protein
LSFNSSGVGRLVAGGTWSSIRRFTQSWAEHHGKFNESKIIRVEKGHGISEGGYDLWSGFKIGSRIK